MWGHVFYLSAFEVNPGSRDLSGRHSGELLPGGGGRHRRQTVYIAGEWAELLPGRWDKLPVGVGYAKRCYRIDNIDQRQ